MKLKPQTERKAAVRRRECLVEGCMRPIHWFGYCRECLTELNEALKRPLFQTTKGGMDV